MRIFFKKKIICWSLKTVQGLKNDIESFVIQEVKRIRLERGISQKNLAFLLDVYVGFIGNVENPKYRAKYNISMLNELAKVLDCSPKDFLPIHPL